jgi:hypothetical protein
MPKRKKKEKRSWDNVHTEYDENGDWNQKRNRIKGAMRQAFRMSPQMWEVTQAARIELPPALKKDGTPGKRPRVRYKCAVCRELFMAKYVQVDHIEPVVPLYKTEADMTYDEMADRIMCKKDNLQLVCSTPMSKNDGKPSCHKIKTDEENFIRKNITEENWFPVLNNALLARMEELKVEFKIYLEEKEQKRLAKLERKRLREEKAKAKAKK